MTHTALPPIAPSNGSRPADAAPRVPSSFWRKAARKAPPPLESPHRDHRRHPASDRASKQNTNLSPLKMGAQSLPSLSLSSRSRPPSSPQESVKAKSTTRSPSHQSPVRARTLGRVVASALLEEEFKSRLSITTVEDMNRLTFDLVKSRSTILVVEEPLARQAISTLFAFGSCQVRLTQVLKIQAWWRLLLRNNKSWKTYAHGALRVWRRRASSTSQVSSSTTAPSTTLSPRRQSHLTTADACPSRPLPGGSSGATATARTHTADVADALARLEKAATSPVRYNIMMDEYMYTLRERSTILLLLERRRSVDRHKKLYYAYADMCVHGIPEDNASWQARFVAEMFVAIVHFKSLPWGWRTRYKLPYPAWRALRWRTPRIATTKSATAPAVDEQQRRRQRQQTLAAINDLVSLCDHQRMQLLGQEQREWQALQKQILVKCALPPTAPQGGKNKGRLAGVAPAAKPLNRKALTPLPLTRPPQNRTLPPLNGHSPNRPRSTQSRSRRPQPPPPRGRPAWVTEPLNRTPTKALRPETECDLEMSRLRQEEKDARTTLENQEYDLRYRLRWQLANPQHTTSS